MHRFERGQSSEEQQQKTKRQKKKMNKKTKTHGEMMNQSPERDNKKVII